MTDSRHFAIYSPQNVASRADGRLFSPSFERNYRPIREALRPYLAGRGGPVLEIGSGTGQHIVQLAADFPALSWVPTDVHPEHLASIAAWRAVKGRANLAAPMFLDATTGWAEAVRALGPLDAVLAFNVIHIAPWCVAEGLVRGAARALAPAAALVLYGAFREGGQHTSEGNVRFDVGLRAANPEWGVRDLEAVAALAEAAGLGPAEITPMPLNNLVVAFRRRAR